MHIVTRGDGYLVEADGHHVDVEEFVRLAQQAAGVADPAERIRLVDRALGLWRGPLLMDLADEELRRRLDARLDELRLTSVELRAEAQLALGQSTRVVADLTDLVRQYPTREPLVACLMLALYRCARRADALRLYRSIRAALMGDLGVEPGPELRDLHQRMLRGDPGLELRSRPVYLVMVRGESLPWSVGGHPALDFCNTFAGWGHPPLPGSEWLSRYQTLAVWTGYMDLADDATVTRLIALARADRGAAAEALAQARELRTHLYSCLTDPDDLAAFGVVARFAEAAARVSVFGRDGDGLGRWRLSPDAGLRLPVHAAARSASELLADPRRFTVRVCPNPRCGWLFLDESGMRKWCSLATCGRSNGHC